MPKLIFQFTLMSTRMLSKYSNGPPWERLLVEQLTLQCHWPEPFISANSSCRHHRRHRHRHRRHRRHRQLELVQILVLLLLDCQLLFQCSINPLTS